MRKYFYLIFIFCHFLIGFSQSPISNDLIPQSETRIDEKLAELKKNPIANKKKTEKILLQLKSKSEELQYIPGVLSSGKDLMALYDSQSKNQETVNLGSQLKTIAQNRKDKDGTISNIYRLNALSLGLIGLYEASLKDFKTAIKTTQGIDNSNKKQYTLSLCYENITGYYQSKRFNNKKYVDSITYYLNKSLEAAKLIKDNNGNISKQLKYDQIAFVNMRLGMFYLEQTDIKGRLILAEKYLLAALNIHKEDASNILPDNRTMLMNQLSWLYQEKSEYKTAIDYAKQALQLEKLHPDPYHKVESFEFLASSYLETGDKEKSKFYMNKYTFLKDSINVATRNIANTTMAKIADQADNEHKESSKRQLIITVALILLATTATLIVWIRRNRIMRRNYEQMIEKLKKEYESSAKDSHNLIENKKEKNTPDEIVDMESSTASNKNIMPLETESRILKKLSTFESSNKFLKKDISLTTLSHQKNTNPKYLSEIIRTHKKQNFNGYINKLRINYIVQKLYNEPKYREYKISYLADESGYTSSQVFVIAFKKETGVTPSYFIENLKKDS